MLVVKKIDDCFAYRNKCNGSVGFVPTMGALHAGHLELVKQSLTTCSITIVSIFLNPKQFSANEDLDKYPVNLKRDLSLLENLNVDCVFTPDALEIYTQDYSILLIENQLSKVLEGKSRPNFFQGVITVVTKLFNICKPTHVFFGLKDAQQVKIIGKLIKDLNYNIQLHCLATVREKNGLALSSRNQYLSEKQKNIASNIHIALLRAHRCIASGEYNVKIIAEAFYSHLNKYDELKLDYFAISDWETLQDVHSSIIGTDWVLISAAVYIGSVRLIDNIICDDKGKVIAEKST